MDVDEHFKAKEKKDLLLRLLSEWEHPSVDKVKKALGGNMEVVEKEDIRMPKVGIIGIAEVNIRI
jgi:hypothetical protein